MSTIKDLKVADVVNAETSPFSMAKDILPNHLDDI